MRDDSWRDYKEVVELVRLLEEKRVECISSNPALDVNGNRTLFPFRQCLNTRLGSEGHVEEVDRDAQNLCRHSFCKFRGTKQSVHV